MNLALRFCRKNLLQLIAAVVLVSLFVWTAPLPARGAPVLIVVAVVAAAAGAVTIYDYNSCGVNIIWGCTDTNGGGTGGANGAGGNGAGGGANGAGGNGAGGGANGAGGGANGAGGGIPQPCQSAATNICGMHGNGFLDANGSCPATPPPDSQCPAPSIGSFYANPPRVQKNDTSVLYWSVTQATQCALSGGGLSLSGLSIAGQQTTNPITDTTNFTLTCQEGSGPTSSQSLNVGLIPAYQEI